MGNSEYSKWIGKTQEKNDKLLPFPAQFMENTLNRDATFIEGKELPPLWHWLYFLESEKLSNLGRDGRTILILNLFGKDNLRSLILSMRLVIYL